MQKKYKFFFHIGIHKTATSFLQLKVFPLVTDFVYCDRNSHPEFKSYILYADDFEFNSKKAYELFFKRLESRPANYLYSDEELYCSPWDGAKDRKRIFDRLTSTFTNIHFVIVIRNQEELLNSLYQEYIKTGGTAKAKIFLQSNAHPLVMNENYFNYFNYINYMINAVGSENISIFLYENFIKNKFFFVKSILDIFQSNFDHINEKIDYATKINISIVPILLPFIRFRNYFVSSPKNPYLFLPMIFYKIFSKVDVFLSRIFSSKKKQFIPKILSTGFLQNCIQSNRELEKLVNIDLKQEGYYRD